MSQNTQTTTQPISAADSVEETQKNNSLPQIPTNDGGKIEKPQTSATAFANSGFANLASSTSPFGNISASKPSIFGKGGQANTSGFGALAASQPSSTISTATTSGFGALAGEKPQIGFGFGGATKSGFGGLGSGGGFGSTLGNGFAGGAGQKLSSFAAPGSTSTTAKASKPLKAFGAPESDEEAGSDADDSEGGAATEDVEAGAAAPEDKKRGKLAKGERAISSNSSRHWNYC